MILYPAKLTYKYKGHKQTVNNMQEPRNYSHFFLNNILEINLEHTIIPIEIR